MTGISNVIHGVFTELQSPEFQATLEPFEAEIIAEVFKLLNAHADKTASPIDNWLYPLVEKALAGKLIQPVDGSKLNQ